MNKNGKWIGTGVLTALLASLCCITPVLALIAGASGFASAFSWLEPFRPYLIALTVLVLAFAWFQKLRPQKEMDCDCDDAEKSSFIESKGFLAAVTIFASLMLAFPSYSKIFYPKPTSAVTITDPTVIKSVEFKITGMTCDGCANHIDHEIQTLDGIAQSAVSYKNANAVVEYDSTQTTLPEIESKINSTGYTVIETKHYGSTY